MNYIRKIGLFIGVGATVAITPFAVKAQTCANSSQTPLTKSRLDQIATNQGIPLSEVGIKFERFALNTLKPGDPIPSNRRLFPSPLRQIKVGIGNRPLAKKFCGIIKRFIKNPYHHLYRGLLLPHWNV